MAVLDHFDIIAGKDLWGGGKATDQSHGIAILQVTRRLFCQEIIHWVSVSCNLSGLAVCCLIGGLDEHGLGDVLTSRHGHLLNLIQLLEQNKQNDNE